MTNRAGHRRAGGIAAHLEEAAAAACECRSGPAVRTAADTEVQKIRQVDYSTCEHGAVFRTEIGGTTIEQRNNGSIRT